jgi:hypothetical protein
MILSSAGPPRLVVLASPCSRDGEVVFRDGSNDRVDAPLRARHARGRALAIAEVSG